MKHERNRKPYDNVLETIGWTPLIRLNQVTRGIRTPIYAKAEFFNPGGSVKDRIGLPIIERAEKGRPPQAGRYDGRRDERQYRCRSGNRRCVARLQVRVHHAGQDVAGKSSL